jgi:MoxR-like ATPase
MNGWPIFRGNGIPHDSIGELPEPPPWRRFTGAPLIDVPPPDEPADPGRRGRGALYQADEDHLPMVNAALYLRRPLLVTGDPGTGKSMLAHAVAHELGLGRVLTWPITSRSTLQDGLYRYDALGRLQESNLLAGASEQPTPPPEIGRFIRLGPLGTALLPWPRPRVLLIDEVDKSDIDLPNDLLAVFEEGEFPIPELARLAESSGPVTVFTDDEGPPVHVSGGRIRCAAFPFVVLTSNAERQFPPAFLRRCIRLDLKPPEHERLSRIVEAHLDGDKLDRSRLLIEEFLRRRGPEDLATDQLLNAVYLTTTAGQLPEAEHRALVDGVFQSLRSVGR